MGLAGCSAAAPTSSSNPPTDAAAPAPNQTREPGTDWVDDSTDAYSQTVPDGVSDRDGDGTPDYRDLSPDDPSTIESPAPPPRMFSTETSAGVYTCTDLLQTMGEDTTNGMPWDDTQPMQPGSEVSEVGFVYSTCDEVKARITQEAHGASEGDEANSLIDYLFSKYEELDPNNVTLAQKMYWTGEDPTPSYDADGYLIDDSDETFYTVDSKISDIVYYTTR